MYFDGVFINNVTPVEHISDKQIFIYSITYKINGKVLWEEGGSLD